MRERLCAANAVSGSSLSKHTHMYIDTLIYVYRKNNIFIYIVYSCLQHDYLLTLPAFTLL